MPYTSPLQLLPATSFPTTPTLGRHGSWSGTSEISANSNLPRSTTYMHRQHRRTPSLSKAIAFATPRPVVKLDCRLPVFDPGVSRDGRDQSAVRPSPSLHQSPPPVNNSTTSTSVITPSPGSTSDEAADKSEDGRGRDLENLAELQEAIKGIQQRRESSPNRSADSESRDPGEEKAMAFQPTESPTECQPLSREAREISHSRYSTETPIVLNRKAESPDSSDIDDDAYRLTKKPVMVRKKSGELVKPALRLSSSRRPSSVPGTPTYSKAVHFDSQLEHIRHFLQLDKPLAVSAGTSPVEPYESDSEFPFASHGFYLRSPPFEWEIVLPNFPGETIERRSMPVRVELVFLSSDNKSLIGTVACANLAFAKHVVARFTLDSWKTTSEVIAEYDDIRCKQRDDGYDRFNFSVKLEDQVNLEKKTLLFCIRYNVGGQEFWDNNGSRNYQVDFRKKAKPQNGKNSMQGTSARAPQRSRPSPPISSARPVSLPASFDDFIDSLDSKYDIFGFMKQLPTGDSSGSTPNLTNPKPANGVTRDPRTHRSGQAFGNRYDFGASLSATIQASNRQADDESVTRVRDEVESTPRPVSSEKCIRKQDSSKSAQANSFSTAPAFAGKNGPSWLSNINVSPAMHSSVAADNPPMSTCYTREKPAIQSNQYNEILDKYCFYGSPKAPHVSHSTRPRSPHVDGPADDSSTSGSSLGGSGTSTSASSSPLLDSPPITGEPRVENPRLVRSSSPTAMANSHQVLRTTSPADVYPYHNHRRSLTRGFPFNEGHAPTAIKG